MKRTVSMAVAIFSLLTSTPSHAQTGVAGSACMNLKTNQPVPCSDGSQRYFQGQQLVQAAYNGREFAKLDALYEQWCTGRERFPDGLWKLAEFSGGFTSSFAAWKSWDRDLAAIQAWQQAAPDSAAASYIEAVYWHEYAWKARGGGYASTVSKEGWALFNERLGKAKAALDAAPLTGSHCPAPAAERISLMIDMGADKEQLTRTYIDAAQRYPEYHALHFAMARQFQPRWGGSAEQYEAFASGAAALTKDFEGMGMYARLYWLVDYNEGLPFRNDPTAGPYWNKLKAGYDDLMRRYPASIHNLGKYAGVACRSSDGALYRRLRSKLDGYQEEAQMNDPVDVCDLRHHWKAD
jgi:hypothetical protein